MPVNNLVNPSEIARVFIFLRELVVELVVGGDFALEGAAFHHCLFPIFSFIEEIYIYVLKNNLPKVFKNIHRAI